MNASDLKSRLKEFHPDLPDILASTSEEELIPLIEELYNDPEANLEALGLAQGLKSHRILQLFERAAKEPDFRLRASAAGAFRSPYLHPSEETLLRLLDDDHPAVRKFAIRASKGEKKTPKVKQKLKDMLGKEEFDLLKDEIKARLEED